MRFVFRPVLTIAATISLGILVSLGAWQLHRLEWKTDLIERTQTRVGAAPIAFSEALKRARADEDMRYAPVTITGRYLHDQEAHVFGTLDGRAGYYIFTPVETTTTGIIYVNRGFAPQAMKSPAARRDAQIEGETTIVGLFRQAEQRRGVAAMFQPVNNPDGNEWFLRDPTLFSNHAGFSAPGVYIDSNGAESDAPWPRGGSTRLEFNNRHLEYAFTWFGLAATLIGVFLFYSRRPG